MIELICNLHIHSSYSDGSGNYTQILQDALDSNLDVIIVTDHNILVKNVERYLQKDDRKALLLTGEEIHNQNRIPQKNHTLVIGCVDEVSPFAYDPQTLINETKLAGGLSFLAHPYEYPLEIFGEEDISWVDWDVRGFTGIELWNGFSEFKTVVKTFPQALYYAFNPELIPHQPLPQTLSKWDEILSNGVRVVAVAGSDSHALQYIAGLFRKTIFPYRYHFSTINNHLLVNEPLSGDLDKDKRMIYQALEIGSSFIGFDLPASTHGFSFSAENDSVQVGMGEVLVISQGATIRINLPHFAELRLIHNGKIIVNLPSADRLVHTVTETGYYRVEAYLPYFGKLRGWIFSNPIYIQKASLNLSE